MDFDFSEEQIALRDLAREILQTEVTLEHLKEIEAANRWFSDRLWRKLADANLLGLAIPEDHGGMGYGIVELCVLLGEIGRAVAPVPARPTLVLAGLPIARFGTEAQKRRWLPAIASGSAVLAGALVDANSGEVRAPATTAKRDGDGWRLDGVKRCVASAEIAQAVLVPATTEQGVGLFLVDPNAAGVSLVTGATSTHERMSEMSLLGVRAGEDDLLGGSEGLSDGASRLGWLHECALVTAAAVQTGVCERAIEITASYLSQREQFGAPIGTFPPVQHRAADCFIDLSALRWTTCRAAWKLDSEGEAGRHAQIAKFFAAESGARIATATQHLHGGMGADRDYPIHRYFLWSKSLELELGSAMPQLSALGRDMARTGPQEFL